MESETSASRLRMLPALAGALMMLGCIVVSCREEDPVTTGANQGSLPTMVTYDVDTYISDSGYVKYHAVTDIWEMYDDTSQPYWRFPKPLVVDILAPGMKPHAHIECDSAQYFTQKQLFRFDGDVVAVNTQRDTFLTPQLFWDQKTTEFYTDSFIHIVKADRVLEGYGFRSNERMTRYTILRPTAILPASAFRGEKDNDNELTRNRDSVYRASEQSFGDPSRSIPVPASQRNQNSPSAMDPTDDTFLAPKPRPGR